MEPVNENKDENLNINSETTETAEATETAETTGVVETAETAEATETAETTGVVETAESAEATGNSETNSESDEVSVEELAAEQPQENSKELLVKKIKIGAVILGGIFILVAAVYMAAVLGGRTNVIEDDAPEPVAEVVEETPVITEAPVVTEAPVEEEDDSVLAVIKGSNQYDDCVYADGGVVIVCKDDKYGAIDYEGNEIVPLGYAEIQQYPTKEGMFVLSNSKTKTVTEDNEGTSYTYEDVVTTYALFDNTGKSIYEGNNAVIASGTTYVVAVVDDKDERQNRAEYYRIGKKEAYMTMYVNDQFSLNGFMDDKTVVMGFTAAPTEDQDTNPTNLTCGIMDENGKVKWLSTIPGMSDFEARVEEWQAENKELQILAKQNKKKKTKKTEEDGEETDEESEEELEEEDDGILHFDEDGNLIEDEEVIEDEDSDEEVIEEIEEELEEEEEEIIDASNGPVFKMDEILSAPNGGFFIYKDLYDVEDPYSWYTEEGKWFADLDTAYMEADDAKGFKIGNFNNGAVDVVSYIHDGETYYNKGSLMVLAVGEKNVLIDIANKEGMGIDSLSDKIVTAVFDEIHLSDADYLMYRDGSIYGYLDLKGQPMKVTYEAATDFVNGYACVIKNGKAVIIDEKFENVEEICEATDVKVSQDVISITSGGETKQYILKEIRDKKN